MAITTINDLTEIQSAGANDVLPISTENGVKKIKASAISPVEIIEIDYNGGALRTILTAGEIKALANQGKAFMVALSPQVGVISYGNVASLVLDSDGCTMDVYVVNNGTFTSLTLSADSDDEVLTV